MVDLLINYGYWGMLISAFLAGSFFPFSSEAVMVGLLAAGLKPAPLIVYGTVGNVAGSMFNYGIGRLGRLDWIEKYMHLKKEKLDQTTRLMAGHGAWMGFFAFVPILGSAITIVLGLMRANIAISLTSIVIGKVLRYVLLIYSAYGTADRGLYRRFTLRQAHYYGYDRTVTLLYRADCRRQIHGKDHGSTWRKPRNLRAYSTADGGFVGQ